jgi:hypothetical protein
MEPVVGVEPTTDGLQKQNGTFAKFRKTSPNHAMAVFVGWIACWSFPAFAKIRQNSRFFSRWW